MLGKQGKQHRPSRLSELYDRLVRNWRTSLLAVVMMTLVGLLATGRLTASEFVEVAGTATALRLFLSRDKRAE